MLFHSTRGKDPNKDFASILMQGLADDGGLFMPDYWPQVDLDEIKSKTSFVDIAKCIVPLFTSSSFSYDETIAIVEPRNDFELFIKNGWVVSLDYFKNNFNPQYSLHKYQIPIDTKYIRRHYSWENYTDFIMNYIDNRQNISKKKLKQI